MPSQLYTNDNVSFLCARDFTYNGKDYKLGQDFPQEDFVTNPENLVRIRWIIPVVEDSSVKPRHWHREVMIRELALIKLGLKKIDDPGDALVREVKAYAEAHPDEAEELLEAEQEGKERVTLVEALTEIAERYDPSDHPYQDVIDHLSSLDDQEEFDRIVAAERADKNRTRIISWAEENPSVEDDSDE